jgi:hypothetical protein
MASKKKAKGIMDVGAAVIIRTVTLHYTGRITAVDDKWIHLDDAAWIADTGRWAEALMTGKLSEVEPYPGPCAVPIGCIVDVSPWAHPLPRATL